MMTKLISFFSFLFFILLFSCRISYAALDDPAGATQDDMLIINSMFDVMLHSPATNVTNSKPKVYLLAIDNNENATIVQTWNISQTKNKLVEIPINEIWSAADMYGNSENSIFSLAFGWISVKENNLQLNSTDTYLFLLNGNSRFLSGSRITELITVILHYNPISVGAAIAYEPSEVENLSVAEIVSNVSSSLADVLGWFWQNFGIYITIVVLAICFGILRWAK